MQGRKGLARRLEQRSWRLRNDRTPVQTESSQTQPQQSSPRTQPCPRPREPADLALCLRHGPLQLPFFYHKRATNAICGADSDCRCRGAGQRNALVNADLAAQGLQNDYRAPSMDDRHLLTRSGRPQRDHLNHVLHGEVRKVEAVGCCPLVHGSGIAVCRRYGNNADDWERRRLGG
jgi:hypothetical protein